MPTTAATAHANAGDVPTAPLRILFVEDNPGDAGLVKIQLEEYGRFDVEHVETLHEAIERLNGHTYDVVLLDLSLPDGQGRETFDMVHTAAPATPVVVLTGLDDEPTALAMVHAGAQDYLVKSGILDGPLVARSVRYAVERHHLQQELEAARRRELEQKDRFLSHVSHQLRSPLAVSFLYATNLLDGIVGPLQPEQQGHLAVAVDALRDQMRLVDELLAAARADATLINIDRAPVALGELMAQIVGKFRPAADDVTVAIHADHDLQPVYVDAKRLEQVLTNLLDNAARVSPAGSTIRMRAFAAPDDPGFAQVEVLDQGPGIPAELCAAIFDRILCERSDADGHRGLGLGLYLCRLLVERHGGRIWAERCAAGGSRFTFILPFLPSPLTVNRGART